MKNIKNITGDPVLQVFDMKRHYAASMKETERLVMRILRRGRYILGDEVALFEKEFADYCGTKYGVGVGSGTAAITISLKAIGVGKADEVITQANTAIPTAMAIVETGARLKLVDIDGTDHNMAPGKLKKALTKRTKAIVPVHLYGNPCRMDPIMSVASKRGIAVIEDACQGHGALYHGKKVGTFGEAGSFSFYPTKNLGCYGDGGIVVTGDKKLYDKMRLIRNYGQKERYDSITKGVNSRLDEVQAAILRYKLTKLDSMNKARQKLAFRYNEALSGIGDLILPEQSPGRTHIYHLYVIRTRYRDKLRNYLSAEGIMTEIHYPVPIHLQRAFRDLGYPKGSFKMSERLSEEIITLPMFSEMRITEVDRVCCLIKEFFKSRSSER